MPRKVVVLGAGPAGLFAAMRLAPDHEVVVLEKEDRVGGLCASLPRGGNVYGHGFHAFHDDDPALIGEFRDLLGDRWIESDRRVRMKLRGRFFSYPLKGLDILRSMEPLVALRCALAFTGTLLTGPFRSEPPRDAEEAIVRLYGRPLYEEFFRTYTSRFWDMPPNEISSLFVTKRIPRMDAVEKLKKILSRLGLNDRHTRLRMTQLGHPKMYSTPEGSGAIYEAMAGKIKEAGGKILLSSRPIEVRLEDGRVREVSAACPDGRRSLACDLLVSTVPINALPDLMRPAPPAEIARAARGLGFRGLITVGVLVDRPRTSENMFTYFHGRSFHRISEPKNFGQKVLPESHSVLLTETTCEPSDRAWHDPVPLIRKVVGDLEEEGFLRESEVRETHAFRARHAYPKYTVGFEKKLSSVRDYLGSIENLVSTGRQGRFDYLRSAVAMKTAWTDAKAKL